MKLLNEAERRVQQKCRRGMLELDLLLHPFVEKEYMNLSNEEKKQFELLLDFPDPLLHAWLLGYETPDPDYLSLIKKINK